MSMLNLNNYLISLGNTPDHSQLFIKAKYLVKIQKHLQSILPMQFKNRYTVGQYTEENGLLVIYVENGAIATRLRNCMPSIQQRMNMVGINIENIKFSIQPQLSLLKNKEPHKTRHLLSQAAIKNLDKLASSLPIKSPLHASLKSLLANSSCKQE